MYDIIIIGAGAAGLTAAIYTCRKKLKTMVISADIGGQTNLALGLENYPGVEGLSGIEVMNNFEKQAKKFGAEINMGKVRKVSQREDGTFLVEKFDDEKHEAKVVILAYGKVHRSLGVPGEDKFFGKGVHTCTTCDAPFYKGKKVIVVGGGNSAFEGALELAHIGATEVHLIHRRDKFRADGVTIDQVKKNDKIKVVVNTVLKEVKGDKFVSGVVIEDVNTKEQQELEVNGVFLEIGFKSDISMVEEMGVKATTAKEIIVDERQKTNIDGLFAAGDVSTTPYKQTVIAAGEGSAAALEAYRYLTGGRGVGLDWS